MGKKSFTSLVQLLSTKEDNILISQFIKQNGIAGFMKQIVILVKGNPSKDLNDFHIITLMKHTDIQIPLMRIRSQSQVKGVMGPGLF